jgi:hypothetical protein
MKLLPSHHWREIFSCNVCLWAFESEAELDIHNYLEPLIMKKYVQNNNNDR